MVFSCDVNEANIFFLESQGKIVPHQKDGFFFRHYEGKGENRNGWLFPQNFSKAWLQVLLTLDSAPNFILLTEEQRTELTLCVSQNLPDFQLSFEADEGDYDYIYSVEKMAELPGKDFQKKRNHISRFMRTYNDDWKFDFLDSVSITAEHLNQIKDIYSRWLESHGHEENEFLVSERKSVELLADYETFKSLNLTCGILYVKNEPVAFAVSSLTTAECLNVHFEKSLEEFSENGALAVLNRELAKSVKEKFPDCRYLNREEDLNVPGLRKSKLSYKPEFLIKKYYGRISTF